MNTMSASRADPAQADPVAAAPASRPLIWDAPVRVFHALAILCFFGAWLTSDSERWRLLHVTLGLTLAGLVAFRVLWGLVGTRHARFAAFVRGPGAVQRYLASLLRGRPEHHAGHNPAGAWAILGLLLLAAAVTASGWARLNDVGGHWVEDVHEALAEGLLALVALHVFGVLVSSLAHRENLVMGMVSGHKAARPDEAVRSAWRSVAVLMVAAVIGFWVWQWRSPVVDVPAEADRGAVIGGHGARHHDDDD